MQRCLILLTVWLGSGFVQAATFTVDTTNTASTLSACTAAAEDCSLAGAVQQANLDAAPDLIAFSIPFTQPGCDAAAQACFISLATPLVITQPLTIDGGTQPGFLANSVSAAQGAHNGHWAIELGGNTTSYFAGGYGLRLQASTTLRGLKFVANGNALRPSVASAKSIVIQGCAFGGSKLGKAANSSSYRGDSDSALVGVGVDTIQFGGLLPTQRNWVPDGYVLLGEANGASNITVQGNIFGYNQQALALESSSGYEREIFIDTRHPQSQAQIGGIDAQARNWIATGIYSQGKAAALENDDTRTPPRVRFENNAIYVNAAGATLAPRFRFELRGGGNVVGGDDSAQGNLIWGGIYTDSGREIIRGNTFVGSRGRPIWFGQTFREVNDANDADSEFKSRLQNFPEIYTVVDLGNQLQISYRVDSAPSNATYPLAIELYLSESDDGEFLLGRDSYPEAMAQQLRTVTLAKPANYSFTINTRVVATATTTAADNEPAETSGFTLYGSALSLVTNQYPDRGSFVVMARVAIQYPVGATYPPFAHGRVKFTANDLNGDRLVTCSGYLSPTTQAGIAEASCVLPATATPLAAGSQRTVRAVFDPAVNTNLDSENPEIDALRGPYRLSSVQTNLSVVGDRLFCDGFEDIGQSACAGQ